MSSNRRIRFGRFVTEKHEIFEGAKSSYIQGSESKNSAEPPAFLLRLAPSMPEKKKTNRSHRDEEPKGVRFSGGKDEISGRQLREISKIPEVSNKEEESIASSSSSSDLDSTSTQSATEGRDNTNKDERGFSSHYFSHHRNRVSNTASSSALYPRFLLHHASSPNRLSATALDCIRNDDCSLLSRILLEDCSGIDVIYSHWPKAERLAGRDPLWHAACSGSAPCIDLLARRIQVELGEEALSICINRRSACGTTPLLIASAKNHAEAVRTLLQYSANPNGANEHGTTPAIIAASYNHQDVLHELGNYRQTNFNASNDVGWTPVLAACANGALEALDYLHQHGNLLNESLSEVKDSFVDFMAVDFSKRDLDGYGCVTLAARYDRGSILSFLCTIHHPQHPRGVNMNQTVLGPGNRTSVSFSSPVSATTSYGDAALHVAARFGCLDAAEVLLLCTHYNDSAYNAHGMTALHVAVIENRLDVIRCLAENLFTREIEEGKDDNHASDAAAADGGITRRRGESCLNEVDGIFGMTPLYLAAALGHAAVVSILTPVSDWSILCAIDAERRFMFWSGGREQNNVNNNNNADSTKERQPPLLAATRNNRIDAIEALLTAGANVDQTDETGHTAISVAARLGFEGVCEVLLRHGANIKIRSKKAGGTPLQKAKKYKHLKIVTMLEEYAASTVNNRSSSKRSTTSSHHHLDESNGHSSSSEEEQIDE